MKEVDKLQTKHPHVEWTPGARLQNAREQAGFTREQIAKHLHLRLRIIEAIENDQYDQVEELVFIRGYLRAYANLLNLPADEIIHAFNQLESSWQETDILSSQAKADEVILTSKRKPSSKRLRWILYLLIIFLLTFLLIRWYYRTYSEPQPQNNGQTTPIIQDDLPVNTQTGDDAGNST